MKKSIIILFSFLVQLTFAQGYVSEYNRNWIFEGNYSTGIESAIQYEPRKQVEKIEYTVINKKGKKKEYLREFNDKGKLLAYSKINNRNHIVPIEKNEYISDNHHKTSHYGRSGKLRYLFEKEYNKGVIGKDRVGWRDPLRIIKSNARNKVVMNKVWTYNEDKCLSNSVWYGRGNKLKRKWEYDYYEACKKSETRLYNGKDKLIKAWNYDCKEEGEQLEMKKKTTQYCKWDESTKDYLLKITQSFDDRGRLRKTVAKYNIKDTMLIESAIYDADDELLYKSIYDRFDHRVTSQHINYKDGEESSKRVYKYENKHLVLYSYYRKGELKSKSEYVFKDDKVLFHSYIQNGKLRSKSEYVYENDLLMELKTYGKKDELTETVKLSY